MLTYNSNSVKKYHEQKRNNVYLNYRGNHWKEEEEFIHFDINMESGEEQEYEQIRKIDQVAYKVLDAQNLQDDFYLNILDWSQKD